MSVIERDLRQLALCARLARRRQKLCDLRLFSFAKSNGNAWLPAWRFFSIYYNFVMSFETVTGQYVETHTDASSFFF
jgi:hypothetical protein